MAISKKLKAKLDELHAPYTVGTCVLKSGAVWKIIKTIEDYQNSGRKVFVLLPVLYMYPDGWGVYGEEDIRDREGIYKIDLYPIVTVEDILEMLKNDYAEKAKLAVEAFLKAKEV